MPGGVGFSDVVAPAHTRLSDGQDDAAEQFVHVKPKLNAYIQRRRERKEEEET